MCRRDGRAAPPSEGGAISSGRHAETTGYREYLAGGNLCYYFLEFPKAYTAGLCVCPSSLLWADLLVLCHL